MAQVTQIVDGRAGFEFWQFPKHMTNSQVSFPTLMYRFNIIQTKPLKKNFLIAEVNLGYKKIKKPRKTSVNCSQLNIELLIPAPQNYMD